MKLNIGLHPRYETVEINYQHELTDFLAGIIQDEFGVSDPFDVAGYVYAMTAQLLLNGEVESLVQWGHDDIARWIQVVKDKL